MVRSDPDWRASLPASTRSSRAASSSRRRGTSPAGPGARCLHVFLLSSDRAGLIERVVVDLARQKIAYRNYVPPTRRTGR